VLTCAAAPHRRIFFGPTVTSIFFAASLISNNGLLSGLKQWPAKLKKDLISTWAAGLCFWPFVDLFVYSLMPVAWIPLGYNAASFFWTIFLSLQAAKQA
jgi:protein Mpv17